MESLVLVTCLLVAFCFPQNIRAAAPTWPSPSDELEDIMYLNTGYRARGFAQPVTPCSAGLGTGRIFAAEMLRTAFHDMTSANAAQGVGGMDASIIFELARADNVGEGFASSVAFLANYYGPAASMSDLLAAGTYSAVRACNGPAIPIRYGRLDSTVAASAGLVPAPQNAISIFRTQFERMGFNQTEMIALVACGHTIGRVHSQNFPQIVPPQTTPNFSLPMDTTDAVFDEKVVTEYLTNTTQDPMIVGISRTNGRDVDRRVFLADNNVTVRAMANPTAFKSTCSTVLQKMLDTVPSTSTLSSSAITPYDVKPSALKLYLLNGAQKGLFSGEIRVRTTLRSASSIAQVQIIYKDRTGGSNCNGCIISGKLAGSASGFDDQFTFYSFSSEIDLTTSISSFNVLVTLTSGNTELYDNNGVSFPMQDTLLLQQPQSCLSSSTNLTVVAAVRNTVTGVPTLKVVTKVPRASNIPVPSLATATASMAAATPSTAGSYKLYTISYSIDSTQSSTAKFDLSLGNTRISLQNAADLSSTCTPLTTTTPPTYLGCYTDSISQRALSGASTVSGTGMSVETCAAYCSKFQFFGVEYASECYCGNAQDSSSVLAAESSCNMACSGNSQQKCGGSNRVSVYQNPSYVPANSPAYPGYTYLGCYSDSTNARALASGPVASDDMSVEFCGNYCGGATYFGLEYSQECFCGSTLASSSTKQAEGDCSMFCTGNATEPCGGSNRLNVYKKVPSTTTSQTTTRSTTSSGTASTLTTSSRVATTSITSTPATSVISSTTTSKTTTSSSASTPTFSNYEYLGCYVDSVGSRTFTGQSTAVASMNYSTCATFCQSYGYMGLEYGIECYCSNTAPGSALKADSECNMNCGGDSNSVCGAGSRLTVFRNPSGPVAPSNPTNVPGFTYTGCYTDKVDSRSLNGATTADSNMTIQNCATFCTARGYKILGTEYSRECFCGNTLANTTVKADESGCSMTCTGNSQQLCGGPDRLSVYTATS